MYNILNLPIKFKHITTIILIIFKGDNIVFSSFVSVTMNLNLIIKRNVF